jgi:hypothetical protein
VLVAHYDTWRGPGADDNTTGEEILKQYLIEDLRAPRRPPLTHVYILVGSEECGLIGFASQVVLGVALGLANVALARGLYAVTALGLAMAPLAGFRFGAPREAPSGGRRGLSGDREGPRRSTTSWLPSVCGSCRASPGSVSARRPPGSVSLSRRA